MKSLLYIVSFLVIQFFTASQIYAQALKDIKEIALMKEGNESVGVAIGDGTAKAIQVFSQPTSITDFYSEMDEEILKVYNYGSNKLYFSKGILNNFELKQGGILVGTIDGDSFQIGDKIVTTIKRTPIGSVRDNRWKTETLKSFHGYVLAGNGAGKARGIPNKTISNNFLKNGSDGLDMFIQLLFNSDDVLTNIDIIEP